MVNSNGLRFTGDGPTSKIKINVSGQTFVTTYETLRRHPETKLGRLALEEGDDTKQQEYYFDADVEVFIEVLRYYRTGQLHAPQTMCFQTFSNQLAYWGIDCDKLEECCQSENEVDIRLEKQFDWFISRFTLERELRWKDHIWYFLTDPHDSYTKYTKASLLWTMTYASMIVLQTVNIAFTTLPNSDNGSGHSNTSQASFLQRKLESPCKAVKVFTDELIHTTGWRVQELCAIFFFLEVVVRFSCCPKKKKFFCSLHVLDLIIVIPDIIACSVGRILWVTADSIPMEKKDICLTFVVLAASLTLFAQMRSLRILSLATVFSELQVLMLALYSSKKEILLLFSSLVISSLLCGPAIYYAELLGTMVHPTDQIQPLIESIPRGYWWTIVTVTTVGYGDYYPTNILGYTMAFIIMMIGLTITALPVAIVGRNFAMYYEYNQKRQILAEKRFSRKKSIAFSKLEL